MQIGRLATKKNLVTWQQILEWVSSVFVVIYLSAAIVAFFALPLQARQWLNHPFLGVLVENTLMINSSGPAQSGSWDAYAQGLRFGNQVQSINGEQVNDIHQLNQILSQLQLGAEVVLGVLTKTGEEIRYSIVLGKFSSFDTVSYFLLPYLIGLISLVTGIWVYALRRRDATGKAFTLFSTSVALAVALLFDVYTNGNLVYLWILSLALCGGALVTLSMLFPVEVPHISRWPILRWLGYLPSLVLFAYAFPWQYNISEPFRYADSNRYSQIYAALSFFIFLGWMIYRLRNEDSPTIREQSRLVLIGAAIAFLPIISWFVLTSTRLDIPFSPTFLAPVLIFPISISYNLARYRLLQTDYIARQVLLYSTLSFLAAIGYGLLVTGMTLIFGGVLGYTNPFLIGATVFVLAFAFVPLRERLQWIINTTFDRGQEIYRQRIQAYSRELTQALDLPDLNLMLRNNIEESLSPESTHIFLVSPGSFHYSALPDKDGKPTSELLFTMESDLVTTLASQHAPIYLGDLQTIPSKLVSERARIGLLGAQIFGPLIGKNRMIGWLALGARRSGQPYTQRDLNYLETISDQTALAFERAQAIQNLESRVHQMNVLTLMTQGLNITVSFDDILELIYAQSNQILPARDFRISLIDQRTGTLNYTFFLENDERKPELENQPIHQGQGLEEEILKTRRPFVTDDYERECRSRGRVAQTKGLFSWIGVPVNTGGDTIGVISLGSRLPAERFSPEQVNLIQAIADQAAGAIVKARLLDETERRARQLATLNEVARSMSSTLELIPLFNQILKSAVEILNCEAGSLLLIDQDTGEYIFEAVVGPVAGNLVGTRLPPGTGLVGKAVTTREGIIVNDVHRSEDWSGKSDRETGFKTNDMMVVPMVYRDDVTGVIEVLNRKDGLPFSKDDQELLSAFVSQAAVSLENARLFTLTDQTLAERVEELSVLQRIDRELNTSLNIDRALRVTLDWAMSQSNAEAGLIGIVEDDRARIMASEGYGNDLKLFQEHGIPLTMEMIGEAVASGQPQFKEFESRNGAPSQTLLPGARQQVIVPIKRESQVIGLVLLENKNPGNLAEEKIGFLSRLGDHASIAITNASLYSEVQAANQAKSDFVSFVSHELKTPMTSIRGFTDLLASGVVGDVNENQTNFLNTIRSNVERMATLVSDLADISRIETGNLRLDFAAIPVDEIIDEVVRSTRAQILEKKQTLIVNAAPDLPPMWGDRTRLIQILTNLVSNAYKYTLPEGLIQVTAEVSDNMWTEGSPKVIHVSVKDNGFGISPENQVKIFQKFYRSDDQKVRDAPGTGLGLNITKQLVELQGGVIWFESEFRVGSIFHFVIPVAETV